MAVETQPELLEVVANFEKKQRQYAAELAIADRATNPWISTAERNAVRLVVAYGRAGGMGKANVVKVGG